MKKNILFVYTNYSTFVKTDFGILSEKHEVVKCQFKPVKGLLKTAFQMLRQLFYLLFNIWKFDSVFIWFADYHSFLPILIAKILRKKTMLVIGGYDVARMPEYGYGSFHGKLRGFCTLFSIKNSTLNMAVSKYVERKVRWIARKANTQLIYNCVNIAENSNIKVVKENLVITVGLIDSERTFYLKGIDTFIEVAQLLPELKFMVIGMNKNLQDRLLKNLSENVEIIERVNHSELETYYKRAKIYCQFSRTESFGVAIVEAINFGCIPVVTNVGGMPELIGNSGFIVKRESAKISQLIKDTVIEFSNSKTVTFNYQLFSVESRSKLILKALAELI